MEPGGMSEQKNNRPRYRLQKRMLPVWPEGRIFVKMRYCVFISHTAFYVNLSLMA